MERRGEIKRRTDGEENGVKGEGTGRAGKWDGMGNVDGREAGGEG